MDKRTALKLTRQYIKLVKEKYDVKKAYLFGSFAWGDAHKDSDIDVAVVLGQKFDFHKTQLDLMRMTWDLETSIEPHPIHVKDFNRDFSVAAEILIYGIPIKV